MQFLSIRCLNCQNLDNIPRLDYDEIPYCSQCACTSNLVPESSAPPPPPSMQKVHQYAAAAEDDLIALFNRNLFLQQQQPTPPISPTTTAAPKFSTSQHYHHSAHLLHPQAPPSPPQHVAEDEMMAIDGASQKHQQQPQQQVGTERVKSADREYAEYLMATDLSSPNSRHELEIALAHGIISQEEYRRSVAPPRKALEENCSAMEMLSAVRRMASPTVSEWCNDYYAGPMEDEDAPCSVHTGAGGCRLRPFDL